MDFKSVVGIISNEIDFAVNKFPLWPTDIIHAGNVVQEESGELAKAILQYVYEPHKSSLEDVKKEAIQTAAMAIRFLISIDDYTNNESIQHKQNIN